MKRTVLMLVTMAWSPATASGQNVQVDTTSLATGPVAMHMLLEKTIFRVDVLTLELRFDQSTMHALETVARNIDSEAAARDSMVQIVLEAADVWARLRFVRGISLNQFADAVIDNVKRARDAGIVTDAMHHEIRDNFRTWYAFLDDRRIQKGDEMFYRIRGDALRTIYQGADGAILLDRTDRGAQRRRAVLGGYFAPGSDFRRKLIASFTRRF